MNFKSFVLIKRNQIQKKYMLYGLMYIIQEQAKLIYDNRNQNHKGK